MPLAGLNQSAPGGWGTMMNRFRAPEDAAPAAATPDVWGRLGGEGMLGAAPPMASAAPSLLSGMDGGSFSPMGAMPPPSAPPAPAAAPLAPSAAPIRRGPGRGQVRGAAPPPNLGTMMRAGGQESLGSMAGNLAGAAGRGIGGAAPATPQYSRASNPRRAAREARYGRG